MSISELDNPLMRRFFRFLDLTKLSLPVIMIGKKIIEKKGKGFKWSNFNQLLLIGQSHLDAAWRWRTKQGIIKAKATFSKALYHIEKVPNFSFAQPSPCYYWWMKEHYPDIFEKIKEAVKAGRWIPIGGMWVESDLNVPSGEALVRQRLYGQRFYLKEFGVLSNVEFMQDCFGFNSNLPQIVKKSGGKMFGTGKPFWNEDHIHPFGMMHWESPDGTRLPTVLIHFGYFLPITYGDVGPRIYLLQKPGEPIRASYETPIKEMEASKSDELMLDNIFGYGLGDGGHGPIEAEITAVKALKTLHPKMFKYFQPGDFVALFRKHFDRWPIWHDEIYLELHRGTYTTHSIIKKNNRVTENLMETLEKMWTTMAAFGYIYDRRALEKYWKLVLYNQFHDILPGSSIPEVYEDSLEEYGQVFDFLDKSIDQLMNDVFLHLGMPKNNAKMILAFNPLNWNQTKCQKIPLPNNQEEYSIYSMKETQLPLQVVEEKEKRYGIIYLEDKEEECIPQLGFQRFSMRKERTTKTISEALKVSLTQTGDQITLENSHLKAEIDKTTGYLTSIYNKLLQAEGLRGPSNRIALFREKKADSWNIDKDYEKNQIDWSPTPEIRISAEGSLYCEVEITTTHEKSTFIQKIGLYADGTSVVLKMDVDWQETEVMSKLIFDTTIDAENVSAENPYAFIDRPVTRIRELDKSRWEYAMQKWISWTDPKTKLGITISNNCKYGFNVKKNELRITLIRSPKCVGYAPETMFVNRGPDGGLDPNKPQFTDQHFHEGLEFRMELHKGDFRENAWREAYNLNYPPICKLQSAKLEEKKERVKDQLQQLPIGESWIKVDAKNVHVGAIKVWEDEKDLSNPTRFVVRLVEKAGKTTPCKFALSGPKPLKRASAVDLLELNPQEIEASADWFSYTIKPYEIATILLEF